MFFNVSFRIFYCQWDVKRCLGNCQKCSLSCVLQRVYRADMYAVAVIEENMNSKIDKYSHNVDVWAIKMSIWIFKLADFLNSLSNMNLFAGSQLPCTCTICCQCVIFYVFYHAQWKEKRNIQLTSLTIASRLALRTNTRGLGLPLSNSWISNISEGCSSTV